MEIKEITYKDKIAIEEDPDYPEENQVTDGNMNEIKEVVNYNGKKLKEVSEIELQTLQEENKKLKSALINVETEEAKSLHIEDASEVPAQLKVMGNQEQKTREGYNLLNSSLFDLSEVSDLATFNQKDGTITFNGTVNADINIRSLRKQIIEGTGKENIVIKTLGGSLNGVLRLVAQDTNYGNIKYSQIGTSAFNDKLIENVEYNIFSITITNGTVLNNLKLGFMIVDDSDVDKEYEQYGAMPSPGFPSKIKCLGSNKNLFDEDNYIENLTINTDGTFKDDSSFKIIKIPVKSNTVYTLSRSAVEESTANIVYGTSDVEPSANATCTYKILHYNITEIQIETTENTKYICIRKTKANTDYRLFVDFKIEEGDNATSYSPYGQGSTEIKKINKNFARNIEYFSTKNKYGTMANAEYYFEKDKSYIISFDTPNTGVQVYLQGQGKNVNYTYEKYSTALCDGKRHSFKVTAIETKVTKVTWGLILRETTTNNTDSGLLSNLMIEEVENSSTTSTDYEEHQEDNYILPIQQEMLSGDYFVKEADGWKEVHNKPELTLDGSDDEEWVLSEAFSNVFVCNKPADLIGYETDLICNITDNFVTNGETLNSLEHGIAVGSKINIKLANINTLEELKQYLSTTNIKLYYKSTHEIKLPCTEEQSAVLDELNNLELFDGINNIITAENIAKLKLKYVADTKTYVDNQVNERLSNIENQIINLSGGN